MYRINDDGVYCLLDNDRVKRYIKLINTKYDINQLMEVMSNSQSLIKRIYSIEMLSVTHLNSLTDEEYMKYFDRFQIGKEHYDIFRTQPRGHQSISSNDYYKSFNNTNNCSEHYKNSIKLNLHGYVYDYNILQFVLELLVGPEIPNLSTSPNEPTMLDLNQYNINSLEDLFKFFYNNKDQFPIDMFNVIFKTYRNKNFDGLRKFEDAGMTKVQSYIRHINKITHALSTITQESLKGDSMQILKLYNATSLFDKNLVCNVEILCDLFLEAAIKNNLDYLKKTKLMYPYLNAGMIKPQEVN